MYFQLVTKRHFTQGLSVSSPMYLENSLKTGSESRHTTHFGSL